MMYPKMYLILYPKWLDRSSGNLDDSFKMV